ncbi:M3 family metallopeptidase [Pseudomonas lurida]|uniref:M3 family metallopeptidase n=1 Tax=Pseudomonas lurida TaxID=244566 RepID=UPI00054B7486|nr:M3 family metallopeptidase [Pseudomonas lurida]
MNNPLLQPYDLAPFSIIRPEHLKPAIDLILADNRNAIAKLLKQQKIAPTWKGLILQLDELSARLQRAWVPVSHLNAVCNTPEIREAYESCLPALSEYSTELGQNRDLFDALYALSISAESQHFNPAQKSVLEQELRALRLSGIDLPPHEQARFKIISARLSELSSHFANQALDATQGWTKAITDEADLDGLPADAKAQLAAAASARGSAGWLITLEQPSIQAILTYAKDRALREEVYVANTTRASDQGPRAGMEDNTQIITETLALRAEMAALLGYSNYAQLSLATKMADTTEQVLEFLDALNRHGQEPARRDLSALKIYAAAQGSSDLKPWDMGFYSEKMRKELLDLSQEEIRQYFPVDHVLNGLFDISRLLFGIEVRELSDFDRCHPDVRLFEVVEEGASIGRFYLDLYARANKRGGAWMDVVTTRRRDAHGELHQPVAQLVCNFTPAGEGHPALLTHDEVTTLFHEFGHGLHHLLTRVEEAGVSGINGVAWDAVELPSQFMENWCWEELGLKLISAHFETGEPLSPELLERMLAGKNFQSGLATLRQVELALFDFELHATHGDGRSVQSVLDSVRSRVSVMPPPHYNRFANTFSHVFAGGYAAGYYSYKWAEVLSADAYSRFEEAGGIDRSVGQSFRETILASGSSRSAMELFVDFRQREPDLQALLRHSGFENVTPLAI